MQPIPIPPLQFHHSPLSTTLPKRTLILHQNPNPNPRRPAKMVAHVGSVQSAVSEAVKLIQSSPPTWQSALLNNLLIFVLGSPILVSGLSLAGIAAAFLLGTLTWRAFGPSGFLLVATYFIIVSPEQTRKSVCSWDLNFCTFFFLRVSWYSVNFIDFGSWFWILFLWSEFNFSECIFFFNCFSSVNIFRNVFWFVDFITEFFGVKFNCFF